MKTLRLLAAALAIAAASSALASGYQIKIQIEGLRDTSVLLGHHFGKKKFVVDTVKVDSKGIGTFRGDSLLHGGIYLVITPSMNYFEVMIDRNAKDQRFELSTDTVDMVKNLKFKNSPANDAFLAYQSFMIEKQKGITDYAAKVRELGAADTSAMGARERKARRDNIAEHREQMQKLEKEVGAYWDNIIANSPKSLLASVIKAMKEIEVPEAPKDDKGNIIDSAFQFRYFQRHFFDNVDFADERLLRTPILESKIDAFFSRAVVPVPDSITVGADIVLGLAQKNDMVFRYALQYLFNQYNDNKIMGMDRVFVHLAEKYYLAGKAKWALQDTSFMRKVGERVEKLRPNLIGETAPELRLFDRENKLVSLHSIKAEYLILYFYEPSCGHCKKSVPDMHKMVKELGNPNVKIAFVYTQIDKDEWLKFIEEKELEGAIHLYDPYQRSNFRNLYDIYSTPTPYVLDKDKKIVAKRIGGETIMDFITKMTEQGAK
jgi:thiol-disulfide isomerase/thioredoxin